MGLFDILSGSNTPNIFDVVEFIDAVTSDPETDGKKDGYERAAKEYEPIYQELKQEYDNAIAEIQQKQHSYEVKCNTEINYLIQLEKKRDNLQEQINSKVQQAATSHGIPVSSLLGSISANSAIGVVRDSSWDMMRFITDSRMRKRKEAEKAGYSEAKSLYQEKINLLREKFNHQKAEANNQLRDYVDLIAKVLLEIEDIKLKIADLEIVLRED